MDLTSWARRLLAASLPAAGWVAALEAAALAGRPGVPLAALPALAVAAFGLSALGLALLALALLLALRWPALGRGFEALQRRPRLARALGALGLLLTLGLHYANAHLYVRLYAGIHAALALATLGTALGAFLLLGQPPRAPAGARFAPVAAALAALLALLVGVPWVVTDEALRSHALEQSTLLDDELLAFDRVAGFLAPVEQAATATLDPALRAAFEPRPVQQASGIARGANVVLVTIDSMRADRWLAGGAREAGLPTLEALGASGVRFSHAYAPSCWTVHSMSAVLLDRLPSQIRFTPLGVTPEYTFVEPAAGSADDPRLFKRYTPVPAGAQPAGFIDALRTAGYETATVAAYVYYFRAAGLTAKFEHVDEAGFRALAIDGSGVAPVPMVERATRFLEARDPQRPFLLWLHFMEPHAPYVAHDPAAQGAGGQARYDSELRHVDAQLAALQADLQARGLDANTLWVVHADHGEEFGDHGGEFHATTLYEEVVRVPLLLRVPGAAGIAPRLVDTPVSLLDLGPTLLDLLGVSSELPLLGRSLLPSLRGEPVPERPVLMECERFTARKRAYLRWPFKLIVDRATGSSQLFALHADPHEQRNLASREPGLLRAMQAELSQLQGLLVR
jgi:arylsulfatase A-like enzyme